MNLYKNTQPGPVPRVAFFTDSFHETNGVALTSRQFAAFAKSRYYPFFSVHPGPKTAHWKRGSFETFELTNSRCALDLEHDLKFDLGFGRHLKPLLRALAAFQPDLVHVTGPGHIGMLGAILAHRLRVPLAASWHTNIHEYAGRRLRMQPFAEAAEQTSWKLALRFYRLASVLFAPNPELVRLLAEGTGRPVHLMERGIDAEQFSPEYRPQGERPFTVGYVGRLSPEKNVRLLAELGEHRVLIVGEGSEREWLRQNLPNAELPGLLHGEALSRAFASMDALVFPSETDTFGNVVIEAAASGVPSIVSARGGPKYLVEPGVTGFVVLNPAEYRSAVAALARDPELRRRMGAAARQRALTRCWSTVFERVYAGYAAAGPKTLPPVSVSPNFHQFSTAR